MKIRMMSLATIAMLLVALLTPTAFADSATVPRTYTSAVSDDGPPSIAWCFAGRAPRQVSGLPWSRVWVERNLFRNKGR